MSWTDVYVSMSVASTATDTKTGVTSGYDKNGGLVFDSTDKDNNGIAESANIYLDDSRQEYLYDNEDGRLLAKSNYHSDEIYETFTYEYDEEGKLIKEHKDCGADGTIEYTTDYRGFLDKAGDFLKGLFD